MKLRIHGNSIRLRLTQPELRRFEDVGHVEETLHLPGSRQLVYALKNSPDVGGLSASFDGEVMSIFMPHSWAQEWIGTDRVGFEGTCSLEAGILDILVEKDFQCLHRRPDGEHAFPHPLASPMEPSEGNG